MLNFKSKTRKKGFTLTEILVAMAAFGLIAGGAISLMLTSTNFASYNEGKLLVNRDIRKFTSELSDNATYSNFFVIYKSFTDRTEVDEGGSGDFLVLAFVDDNNPNLFTAVIGYYRSATGSVEGPVQKFAYQFLPASGAALSDILPPANTVGTHSEVIELSKGLSNGRLFYNFFNRSITVQGEILHQGSNLKQATNTYNFTVSPRG